MDMQVSDLDKALAQLGPQFAAVTDKHDEEDSFVADNYDALKEHRVFSALVPVELGGGGQSYTKMAKFIRGLAAHCSSTALAVSMHQHLVAAAVWNFRNGNEGGADMLRPFSVIPQI